MAKQKRSKVTKIKDTEYEFISDNETPNCPRCNIRDYKIMNSRKEGNNIKFYAKCKCGYHFSYHKSIKSIFTGSDNNEISEPTTN